MENWSDEDERDHCLIFSGNGIHYVPILRPVVVVRLSVHQRHPMLLVVASNLHCKLVNVPIEVG